jgi:hypothetical protein
MGTEQEVTAVVVRQRPFRSWKELEESRTWRMKDRAVGWKEFSHYIRKSHP